MKLLTTIFIILFSLRVQAQNYSLASGEISYTVQFPLKTIVGISKNLKGKGFCKNNTCEFLFASKVSDFNSGDGNRDSHMLEVTKAALNPIVFSKVVINNKTQSSKVVSSIEINFAGKKHLYEKVSIQNFQQDAHQIIIKGDMTILLSDFNIERPSLLSVKIDNEVNINYSLKLKKE